MCRPFLHVGGEQRVQQIIHMVLLLQGCLPAHPDTVTLGGLPEVVTDRLTSSKILK